MLLVFLTGFIDCPKASVFFALSRLKLLAQKALSCLAALFLSLLFGFFVCDSGYIKIQISG